MTSFIEHMSTYAKYHRDPRNILTHIFGVPIIVFSVIVLLSRPTLFVVEGFAITPAVIGFVLSMAFYLRLNLVFGLIMAVFMGTGLYFAATIAQLSLTTWLATGIALFVGGWIIQFVGHHYEGKKPAFVDDLVGLLIGPLFVTAELLFFIGMFSELKADIESRAGIIKKQTPKPVNA